MANSVIFMMAHLSIMAYDYVATSIDYIQRLSIGLHSVRARVIASWSAQPADIFCFAFVLKLTSPNFVYFFVDEPVIKCPCRVNYSHS